MGYGRDKNYSFFFWESLEPEMREEAKISQILLFVRPSALYNVLDMTGRTLDMLLGHP